MKRDLDKSYAGLYEVSVGGSVLKGETPTQAAQRETFEETGIIIFELNHKRTCVSKENNTIYYLFVAYVDINKNSVVLQEGEMIGWKWVSNSDIYRFLDSEKHVPGHRDRVKSVVISNVLKK